MTKDLDQTKKENKKNVLPFILTLFALACACIVFTVLCLCNVKTPFISDNAVLFIILSCTLISILCGVAVWLLVKNKETLYKTFLSGFIFLLFCLIVCFILQKTGFFLVIKDAESLQKYLENAGAWMPICYILLQYLQVVILPIPSIVSTLAGLALFGPIKTIIYSLIGIILGSLTAFWIGRKLGHKAVAWMVGEETLEKWQKKLKGKDNFLLTIMFLLPLFPDDILCFIAGLSSMSFTYFIIMIAICRVLAVSTTCYSVDFIPVNTWWGLLIWGIIIAVILLAFCLIYKNLDKLQKFFSKHFKFKKKNNHK